MFSAQETSTNNKYGVESCSQRISQHGTVVQQVQCRIMQSQNRSSMLVITAEVLRANIDWKSVFSLKLGQLDPKFQGEVVSPANHSSCS